MRLRDGAHLPEAAICLSTVSCISTTRTALTSSAGLLRPSTMKLRMMLHRRSSNLPIVSLTCVVSLDVLRPHIVLQRYHERCKSNSYGSQLMGMCNVPLASVLGLLASSGLHLSLRFGEFILGHLAGHTQTQLGLLTIAEALVASIAAVSLCGRAPGRSRR